jgi:hypothetical protein
VRWRGRRRTALLCSAGATATTGFAEASGLSLTCGYARHLESPRANGYMVVETRVGGHSHPIQGNPGGPLRPQPAIVVIIVCGVAR